MLFVLGIGLNTIVLILSIFTVFPDIAANTTVKNLLCLIIIAVQLLSILIGNLYQKHIDREKFGENVSRSKLIKELAPYKHDSVLGAREEMRQGLIVLTTVFLSCSLYWAFMTKDALKFIMVVCIVAIAFIYADYATHNTFYTKRYDEKLCDEKSSPNSTRGLARIYRHEYARLGFKRIHNRKYYTALSRYTKAREGLQDKCIKCILFSKIDAIKKPEIYYGAVIAFFNIFLILPNAADKAIENILPFSINTSKRFLPYILIIINVVFAFINIASISKYSKTCEYIKTIAAALQNNGTEAFKERFERYNELKRNYDFKLIRARGIYMFNSLAIDAGIDLDTFLDNQAHKNEKRHQDKCSKSKNSREYKKNLKYRMLYIHRFHTNFQRFIHTVILSYIALACLLLDLHIDWVMIGIIFAAVSVAVLILGFFILPNIGRFQIAKQCKLIIKQILLYDSKTYYETRDKFERTRLGKLSLKSRKRLFPILKIIIKIRNKLNGYKIMCIENRSTPSDSPKIYAITHIGKLDIETVVTYINEHFILLTGDFENLYGTVDGTLIMLNGCIFVRKDDAEDRQLSKQKIIHTLNSGGNIMWFPEGVWNLSPNLPVLPMPYGIVDVARKTNAVIIPIAIEEYGKKFIVNIGENYRVNKDNELINEILNFRETMVTLKYQIWESVPQMNQTEVLSYEEMENSFLEQRLNQWSLPKEKIFSWIFKPKNIVTYNEAFEHLSLLMPTSNNAFLFSKRNHN